MINAIAVVVRSTYKHNACHHRDFHDAKVKNPLAAYAAPEIFRGPSCLMNCSY